MRVLVADDHPLFREGIKPLLAKLDEAVEILEAADYPAAYAALERAGGVDLALIDLYMPGMHGREGILRIRRVFPDVPLVILSASEEPEDIQQLLDLGALGYITKSSPGEVILQALRLVLAGGIYLPPKLLGARPSPEEAPTPARQKVPLTARQQEVLRELAQGKSNRQIAESLQVTEGTVKIHLATIFRRLGVSNRTEAVLAAQRMHLTQADTSGHAP